MKKSYMAFFAMLPVVFASTAAAQGFSQTSGSAHDLIWHQPSSGSLSIGSFNGNTMSHVPISFQSPDWAWFRGDFDGDGIGDLMGRHQQTGNNTLLSVGADGTASSSVINQVADPKWQVVAVADISGDGNSDIIWRHADSGLIWMYAMDGNRILFSQQVAKVADMQWKIAGTGDFNGDGTDDIVWRHGVTGVNYLYFMQQGEMASGKVLSVAPVEWQIAQVADINGDNTDDLLWRNANTGLNWIYGMSAGSIATSRQLNQVADNQWFMVDSADYNGDGTDDLLWRHQTTFALASYQMSDYAIQAIPVYDTPPGGEWQLINTLPAIPATASPDPEPTAFSLPGKVEAEDYNAFFDTTPGNTGGAYRDDDVDIQATTDQGGGFNVGWVSAGETLDYVVEVTEAAEFRVLVRVATEHDGSGFHLQLNGQPIGSSFVAPNTGGWQLWTTIEQKLSLPEGQHTLTLAFDGGEVNINHLEFIKVEPDPEPDGWQLVWQDEFDGSSIDSSRWEFEVNGKGGGNNELQYYTDRLDNAFIENGNLVIQALQETFTGADGTRNYTSARLRTINKGDWLYGRFEIRARMPEGQGLWPAIWMLPTDWVYGGWAASGEIDIFEGVNLNGAGGNNVYGTLHYGGEWPNNTHTGTSMVPASSVTDNFHTYAIEWEEGEVRWYVDGQHYQTQTDWFSEAAAYPAPFNQRFHMILNVAVGGVWPGSPDSTTVFPQRMEVDYVRVYQRNGGSNDCEQTGPYQGQATTIPGRLEGENYDEGCAGVAYSDVDAENLGGEYRTDQVDIGATSDGGSGHYLGWLRDGEWVEYTVNVEEAGNYDFHFRTSSAGDGSILRIVEGNQVVVNDMAIPQTGAWQTWRNTTAHSVALSAGLHTFRLHIIDGDFNLNYIDIQPAAPSPFVVDKSRGEWTLVVIPDTQHYSQNRDNAPIAHMRTAFDWLVSIKDSLNIKFVQGLGDITESWNNAWEWDNSTSAWYKLYDQIPFMPIVGNHDDPWTMNQYFPVSSFANEPWYGGDFGGIENNYGLMTISNEDYMFLHVEAYDQYSDYRPEGMAWAKQVLAANPARKVILATHDTWATNHIKDNLLTQYDNIVLSNAGHVCQREAHYLTSGPNGGVANNFIVDYQCDAQEVMLLRYYIFKPLEDRVDYFTYSPVTQAFEVDDSSQGSFALEQADP